MPDQILVTGGTGKTGRFVSQHLVARGIAARVASRMPQGPDQVCFDWNDSSTFDAALDGITAIYMVAPPDTLEVLQGMRPFMERAVAANVGPLVLLSASSTPPGGPMMGAAHQWLIDHAPNWAALRPTWFMQNFLDYPHANAIKEERKIYSATGPGRVGFIDAEDIARVAVEALTSTALKNRDVTLTGPEALDYQDVARLIAEAIGSPVTYHELSIEALAARFEAEGMPPEYAQGLAAVDGEIAGGSEEQITDEVAAITGRPARSFANFAAANRAVWEKNRG